MKRPVVHRKGTPKSRNGCVTCKIRRIKCDEARPGCLRCLSTGRKCDGYAIASQKTQPRAVKLSNPCTMLSRTNGVPMNMLELRSFEYFRTQTVVDIVGHFDSPLWSKLILQASHSEPAVQYAAIALGALHEKVELQRSMQRLADQTQCIDMDFPIRQYTKSLVSIRDLLYRADTRSIELVLISCLVCIYYELLQENYPAAWTHLEKALKIMKPPRRRAEIRPPNEALYHAVNLIAVDEDLIQAFARLDVQASSYLSRRRPRLSTVILPTDVPTRFTSLSQSRDTLNGIIGQLQHFMWSTVEKIRCGSPGPIPLPAVAEVYRMKLLLDIWTDSFNAFLNHPTTTMNAREECGKKVLLIQQNVAYIKTFTCLYSEESIFGQLDDEFNKIISNAEFLLAESQHTESSRVPLALDMAIIEALFGTAIKCRSYSLRRRAAALLQKVTWREGVWDASIMARIAKRLIAAEEEILGDLDKIPPRVPEFWRAHAVGFTIDWETRHVKLFCNRPLNGMDERWSGHKDFTAW